MSLTAALPFPSPFLTVLNTNYSPNKGEAGQITALLNLPEQNLRELDANIARVEETLNKLRIQRETLQDFIDSHRALLSPFRRLPEDIVREIFLRCLDPYPIRSTKRAPLLLTTICRSWRDIALATPRLWNSIHVFLPSTSALTMIIADDIGKQKMKDEYRHLMEQRRAGVEIRLKRSGSVPLSFSVSFGMRGRAPMPIVEPKPDHRDVMMQSVLETFIQHRTRWKEVRFWGSVGSQIIQSLGTLKPEELPQLEALEPSFSNWDIDWSLHNVDNLLSAPSLHKLNLATHRNRFVDLPVQWERMTELTICPRAVGSFVAIDALQILSFTHKNIRKCSFLVDIPRNAHPPNYAADLQSTLIHLPLLRSMDLRFRKLGEDEIADVRSEEVSDQDVGAFMAVLSCPCLKHLIIDGGAVAMENSPLTQFLARSECRLESFITDFMMSDKAMVHTLQLMPDLTSLTLSCGSAHAPDGVGISLEALKTVDPENSKLLCPSLQHLRLMYVNRTNADLLLEAVKARMEQPTSSSGVAVRLKSLKANFNKHPGERYRSRVEEIRRQGLDIQWTFPKLNNGNMEDSPEAGHPRHSFPIYPFVSMYPNDYTETY
ncbi:hypothetical protein V5O48_000926 [Marasmius crinis-equi]|uniref:F-box domain-containing protein n=1 Tax=Marasmius crinis-equi TaxID=585013 RepID=A0ABR3G0J2_9AGAR